MSVSGQSLDPFSDSFPVLATLLKLSLNWKRELESLEKVIVCIIAIHIFTRSRKIALPIQTLTDAVEKTYKG